MLPKQSPLFVAWMALVSLLFSLDAMTAETRIAVLDPPPKLLDAISVALSPWGLRIVPVTGVTPPADMPSATLSARATASARGVGAVAWVALSPARQTSLWLYDAQTEQVTVRSLSVSLPFDEASAAAVALTLKTLLRSTTIAPQAERPGPEVSTPTPTPTSPPPSTSPPPPPSPPPSTSPPPPTSPSTPPHSWRLDAFATAHFPTDATPSVAPRAGLGLSWWPPPWRERFGLGVDVRAGTSVGFSSRSFVGTFSDLAAGASARARLGGQRLSVEVLAGPSLHLTSLSGTSTETGRSTTIQRVDPALDVAVVPQVSLGGRAGIGLFFGSTVMLQTQRYSLDSDLLLRVPAVGFDIGGRASLALD
jgi:hypothetical protein